MSIRFFETLKIVPVITFTYQDSLIQLRVGLPIFLKSYLLFSKLLKIVDVEKT